jgi:hypothetical protein
MNYNKYIHLEKLAEIAETEFGRTREEFWRDVYHLTEETEQEEEPEK